MSDRSNSAIDSLFSQWDKPNSPGCALCVIKDGQLVYARGYGQATLEYDAPITPSTIFHVASVSKQFTAFAIALLEQEGKLALGDDARRYVPELPDFGRVITIRHLIHHTSGLRDQWALLEAAGWRMSDVITTSDIMELVQRQQDLNFAPGEEYAYCNTGYTLMAQIVQRVSGMPFRDFCAQRIFQPLGMRDTHFHDDCRLVVPGRAYSYVPVGDGTFWNAILSYSNAGGTSLFTTVEDLARWDQNFYDAKVGGTAVIDRMHTRGVLNDGTVLSYAFGLSLGEYRGLRIVEHAGGDAGFRCMLTRFPDQHFTVAVLGNVSDINPGKLVRQVADVYLAGQLKEEERLAANAATSAEPHTTDTPPAEDEASVRAGIYYSAATSETLWLEARDGKLVIPSEPGLELQPVAPGRYQLSVVPEVKFRFVTSPDGRSEVHQTSGTGKPIVYAAVAPAHPTAEQLAEYAGTYYSPEMDVIYTVILKDGAPVLHQHKYGDAPMKPTFTDAFKCEFTDGVGSSGSMDLVFERADGKVHGFKISAGRIRNVRFMRLAI
jgi:CubicO group peptidase (beta-lactamase class C family)